MGEESTSTKSTTEITVSYEVLYDMLRNEKAQFALQKLDPSFFSQVLRYLEQQLLHIQQSKYKTDLFSSTERSKAEMQLHNAKRILRELYERREKKIIDMALNKSKTNTAIIDTESLLQEERAFFEALVILFNRYREGVLNNIFHLKHPLIAMTQHEVQAEDFEEAKHPTEIDKTFENIEEKEEQHTVTKEEEQSTDYLNTPLEKRKTIFSQLEEKEEKKEDNSDALHQREHQNQELKEQQNQNRNITVAFTKAVERFVDEDLNYHGPFAPGETAEIPSKIAAILLEQGKAEKK